MEGPLFIDGEPTNRTFSVYGFIESEFRFTIASPDTT